MAESYENLNVWKDGMDLVSDVYRLTRKFPRDELFGIISQIRRASVSVPSNIAEGSGRNSKKEFSRFLDISVGSLNEVNSLLEVSLRLDYVSRKECDTLIERIKKLGSSLGGLRKYLNK